ncbi:MAG: DUF2961 domain-containing protein [Tannerella sp.]|jgi:hypothetical protein|nr:DUF2961 domain-containing protein [Tannerella sp.]
MKSRISIVLVCILVHLGVNAQTKDLSDLKAFGTMGKELKTLTKDKETVLWEYKGKGVMTHAWFGGSFPSYEQTRIKYYVDGETTPSIDMELFMGHGIGFNDSNAPWMVSKMGKTGSPSGIYNTFRIPFGKEIKVTAQLASGAPDNPDFWFILRGTENLPVTLGGVQLPDKARLKLYKIENKEFDPLVEFDMCNVTGKGAMFLVTLEAKGLRQSNHVSDISYLESCIRAYINGNNQPLLLSSGLEDYFLGTFYFNKGGYYGEIAGVTHLDKKAAEFSGYRFHDEDPVFFQNGLRLTNRVGEMVGDRIIQDPPRTRYNTYVWLYQW